MALPSRVSDLTGFDLLLSVARLGSLGRAAAEHGMSQPAASARMRLLEGRLGLALIERSPRGSRLTPAGALVADWAQAAIDAAAALDEGVTALRRERDSRVRIAASMTVAEYLLPTWLTALRAVDPGAAVALMAVNSAEVAGAVLADAADVGFVEGPDLPDGLRAEPVGADVLTVVVAPAHPWARRAGRHGITARELAETALVAREAGSGTRRYLEEALAAQAGLDRVPPLAELSSTTAIKAAVAAGAGPAVLSSLAVAAELSAGTLRAVPVSGLDLRRTLRAVWPAGRRLTGPARDLYTIAARSGARSGPRSKSWPAGTLSAGPARLASLSLAQRDQVRRLMDQMLEVGLPPVLRLGGTPLPLAGRARVYACGITPYDVTHLGHAATFVWADTLSRVLHAGGAEVIMCRNVTDVDDVLLAAASRDGSPYDRFAAIQQFYFDQDMTALGVGRPALEPRAHVFIPQVIALAAGLLDRGAAYQRDGQVYFRGAAAARRAVPDQAEALRLATEYGDQPGDPRKDDPFDVAVWQASRDGEPAWASPWGPGRPGWHAECAAMALHAFGAAVDVQAGGGDLRFPHHAYQAALAETFTGVTPFARARLNAGVVRVAGAKMAKSTGNLVLVKELLADYPAAAVRLLILDRHWHEDWDYDRAGVDAAAARLERIAAAAGRPAHGPAGHDEAAIAAVRTALADDLDVPAALHIAEQEGGPAARSLGSLLGLW